MQMFHVSGFGQKAAILGTMLVVFSAFAGNRMLCDKYQDGPLNKNCGDPPPAGLCTGNCDQITYSGPGGMCVWTGSWWNNCTVLPTFTIVETHTTYEQCDIDGAASGYGWCECSNLVKSTTTQTKICDCN